MAPPFASMPTMPHQHRVSKRHALPHHPPFPPAWSRGALRCQPVPNGVRHGQRGGIHATVAARHPSAARYQAVSMPQAPPMHGRPGCGRRTFLLRGGGERCPRATRGGAEGPRRYCPMVLR